MLNNKWGGLRVSPLANLEALNKLRLRVRPSSQLPCWMPKVWSPLTKSYWFWSWITSWPLLKPDQYNPQIQMLTLFVVTKSTVTTKSSSNKICWEGGHRFSFYVPYYLKFLIIGLRGEAQWLNIYLLCVRVAIKRKKSNFCLQIMK